MIIQMKGLFYEWEDTKNWWTDRSQSFWNGHNDLL